MDRIAKMEARLGKRIDKQEDSLSKFKGVAEKLLARVDMTERRAFGRYALQIPFNAAAKLGELEKTLAISARVAGELAWLYFLDTSIVSRQSLRPWRITLLEVGKAMIGQIYRALGYDPTPTQFRINIIR